MKKSCLILLLGWLSFSLSATNYTPFVTDAEAKKAIKTFAKEMAVKHQFDEQQLFQQLSSMEHRQDIIERITKPAEGLPWHRYRTIFIKDKRIDQGVEFWNKHQGLLNRAYEEYGVEPSMIVGIIGVETFYGRIQGNFPVLEALHTLGFYYPKRSKFFRSELAQFLILARDQGWPLASIKGSYAGAMGMGQFISSSYRNFGVDFDGDGKINLFDNPADMIGSVANYFKRHGWKANGFVAEPIQFQKAHKPLLQKGLKLKHQLADLKAKNIDTKKLAGKTKKVGIFAFEQTSGADEHWLVGDNFYAITRYNHSELYALAAFQLSELIREKREAQRQNVTEAVAGK
ncbi:lytic murein transglycosylase B [Aliikangiella marina]|nr:lytic murein transglycosylase B [Aliikangiella marina]